MLTKPILHNGFKISEDIIIKKRLEKIFFTEVYILSDDRYFYLFTNLKLDAILSNKDKYELLTIHQNNNDYVGIIIKEHIPENINKIIEDLTIKKGFSCVAGMNDLKKLLIDEVIKPLLNPEKFKKYKVSIPKGILLYGPPGCGKTFIVRKLAEEIGYNFFEKHASDILSKYVHESAEKIASIFEMAKSNSPAIIFIDESEAIIPCSDNLNSSSQYKQEEINQFLVELNDVGENVLVVFATNAPELMNLRALRSGRTDKRIFVPPPDFEARKELFKISLLERPYSKNIYFDKLSKITNNFSCSDIVTIVDNVARFAANREIVIDEEMVISEIKRFKPITLEEIEKYYQFESFERW